MRAAMPMPLVFILLKIFDPESVAVQRCSCRVVSDSIAKGKGGIRLVQTSQALQGNPFMQAHAIRNRKSVEVRSRIEPELKGKSVEVLASLGLDLSVRSDCSCAK